jgi:hypothetical protein
MTFVLRKERKSSVLKINYWAEELDIRGSNRRMEEIT